ncbi:hypothetical protein [Brachyspira sp.]|uniref:hypothetical protein n=1 Tax=Brachyspira sp. TaxID=1977261 RepID=UPI0026051AD1|nr:hypothetical protein [Brachyspira sp.]
MAFDINKKGIEFNYIDSKKYISSLNEIINNNKNIYIIESVSGREKNIKKDYKIRKVIIKNDNIFDYDSSETIKYINKNEINNIKNKQYTYFLSRDAFIEYYNILYDKKIKSKEYIKRIKDKIKQKVYMDTIFPAYILRSKETTNNTNKRKNLYFYTLEEIELFDIIVKYFELETALLIRILFSRDNYYFNIIEAEIKCLYKNIQNNDDKLVYYDYKLYYMPFFIFDNFKQGKIIENEYNKLIKLCRKTYKSFKNSHKEKKEYTYLGYKLENKESCYKKNLFKLFNIFSYEDYKNDAYLQEYIELNKKLIDYQIEYERFIKYYSHFFNDDILNCLYFTDRISKDDFCYFKEKTEELKKLNSENNKKYKTVNLNKEDENIIYEIITKDNYKKLPIGYIELYNFNKLYNKSSKNHYINNIALISKYRFLKKILQ